MTQTHPMMNYYEKCRNERGEVTNQQYLEWLGEKLGPAISLVYDAPVRNDYDCVRLAVNGGEWDLMTTVKGMRSFSESDVDEISYIYGNK